MTGLNDSDKKVKVWSSHLFQHKGALSQLKKLLDGKVAFFMNFWFYTFCSLLVEMVLCFLFKQYIGHLKRKTNIPVIYNLDSDNIVLKFPLLNLTC